MLSDILHFIEFLLVFVLALIVLFVVLLVVVSKMPHDNPLRMILMALSHRVGATAGLMVVDPVVTGVPVIGEVWDVATIAWLLYFWFTFIRQAIVIMRQSSQSSAPPMTIPHPPPSQAKAVPPASSPLQLGRH